MPRIGKQYLMFMRGKMRTVDLEFCERSFYVIPETIFEFVCIRMAAIFVGRWRPSLLARPYYGGLCIAKSSPANHEEERG